MTTENQAPEGAPVALAVPRPFDAVKSFANGVLKMLDERIEVAARASHPFMDKFGDHPETIVAAKAQASELREVRNQVRILGDRALVDLMKFRPAAREAAPAQTWRADYPASEAELSAEREKARADERLYGLGATVNGWHVPAHVVSIYRLSAAQSPAEAHGPNEAIRQALEALESASQPVEHVLPFSNVCDCTQCGSVRAIKSAKAILRAAVAQ